MKIQRMKEIIDMKAIKNILFLVLCNGDASIARELEEFEKLFDKIFTGHSCDKEKLEKAISEASGDDMTEYLDIVIRHILNIIPDDTDARDIAEIYRFASKMYASLDVYTDAVFYSQCAESFLRTLFEKDKSVHEALSSLYILQSSLYKKEDNLEESLKSCFKSIVLYLDTPEIHTEGSAFVQVFAFSKLAAGFAKKGDRDFAEKYFDMATEWCKAAGFDAKLAKKIYLFNVIF